MKNHTLKQKQQKKCFVCQKEAVAEHHIISVPVAASCYMVQFGFPKVDRNKAQVTKRIARHLRIANGKVPLCDACHRKVNAIQTAIARKVLELLPDDIGSEQLRSFGLGSRH